MQMQQTKNLNPEILKFELGKQWVIRISLLILHSTLFVLNTKSISNEPTNDKGNFEGILNLKPIFDDTKHFLLHWATLIHNLYAVS